MIINRSKSTMDNLVDLIRESNPGLTIAAGQFTVVSITADTAGQDNNTRIGIVATANAGFRGTLDLWYKRATLTQGIISPITQIQRNSGESNASVGSRILAALNIKDSEVVINGGAGWGNDGVQTIATISNSLIYLPGQSYQVTVTSGAVIASMVFDSVFQDQSIKDTFYVYGVNYNSSQTYVYGTLVSLTGFTPTVPDPIGFRTTYSSLVGRATEFVCPAGSLPQDPTVARVYDMGNNLLYTFTGGVRGTGYSAAVINFNNPGVNLPTGVRLRVDFSMS